MDRLELATVRAEAARQVLGNEMFTAAFADTRQAILEAWAKLDNTRGDTPDDLHRMLKCLDRVRRCLEIHIETGKLAEKEIEGRQKRLFSFGKNKLG
jgi:hypothetical protein